MTTVRNVNAVRRRDSKKEKSTDAVVQRYNLELLHCLDEMKLKRDELHRDVISLTDEQTKLQGDLLMLTSQLGRVNESLCHRLAEKDQCDHMILEYEDAFQKLLDGSESLLTSVRKAVQLVAPDIILEESEPSQSRTVTRQSKLSVTSHPLHTPGSRAETRAEIKSRLERESRQPSRADFKPDADLTPR